MQGPPVSEVIRLSVTFGEPSGSPHTVPEARQNTWTWTSSATGDEAVAAMQIAADGSIVVVGSTQYYLGGSDGALEAWPCRFSTARV